MTYCVEDLMVLLLAYSSGCAGKFDNDYLFNAMNAIINIYHFLVLLTSCVILEFYRTF